MRVRERVRVRVRVSFASMSSRRVRASQEPTASQEPQRGRQTLPPLVSLDSNVNVNVNVNARPTRSAAATAAGAAATGEFLATADMLVQLAQGLVKAVEEDGHGRSTGAGGGEHVDLCERIAAICSTSQQGRCPDDVYRVALAFFGVLPRGDAELGPYGKRPEGRWRRLFFDLCSAFHKDWAGWEYMGAAADNDTNPNFSTTSRLSGALAERPSQHPDGLRTLVAQAGPAAARDRSAWYDALAFSWHAYQEMVASYEDGGLRGLAEDDFNFIVAALVSEVEDAVKTEKVAKVLARVDRGVGSRGLAEAAAVRLAIARRERRLDPGAHAATEKAILTHEGPFAALWLLLKLTGAQRRGIGFEFYHADMELVHLIFSEFFEKSMVFMTPKRVDISDVTTELYEKIDDLLEKRLADPYGAPRMMPLVLDLDTDFSTLPELALRTGNGTLVTRMFSTPLEGQALQEIGSNVESTWGAIRAGFQASFELYDEEERAKYNAAVLGLIELLIQAEYAKGRFVSMSYEGELRLLLKDIEARAPPTTPTQMALKVALGLLHQAAYARETDFAGEMQELLAADPSVQELQDLGLGV